MVERAKEVEQCTFSEHRSETGMRVGEKEKWDEYYRADVPVNPPEVAALGDELRGWFEKILPRGQIKILEAGCGAGAQSLALAESARFAVHLLDSSEAALSSAKTLFASRGLTAAAECGDLFASGNPDFDLVFNSGVIEHYSFDDQVSMVRAMAMRSKGLVAVLAPNTHCYWYWIARVGHAAGGRWPFGIEMPVSHLADVFKAAGVELLEEKYLGRPRAGMFLRDVPGIESSLREVLLECHASPLISDEQACYLYGAIGSVKATVKATSPAAAPLSSSERFTADALRAMVADSLSLRVSAQSEIAGLKSESTDLKRELSSQQESMTRAERVITSLTAKAQHGDAEVRRLKELVGTTEVAARTNEVSARNAREQTSVLLQQLSVSKDHLQQVGAELQESRTLLDASRSLSRSFANGIAHYEANLDSALSTYRVQRAWRLMIAIRKAYDFWARRGWVGRLRAFYLLLRAPFRLSRYYPDQEIQLPALRSYVPQWDEEAETAADSAAASPRFLAPLPRKYDVVILAIIDFDFRFQRPQQIASQFAKNGHRVFWISPTRVAPPSSGDPYFLHSLRENIWEVHLRGTQPDIYLGDLKLENKLAFEESLRHLYRDLAVSENLILTQLPFWRSLAFTLRQEHGGVLGYDCMDEWDSFENMGEFNRTEERALVRECDVLLVTAEVLRQKFIDRGLSPVLVRNGVDYGFFSNSINLSLLADVPRPIVGYFGAIADWIDLDLVYEVAKLRPQYSFVLIGQVFGRDITLLQALPNVRLLGNQPYELIPSYLREFDACTIPFLLNEVTAATDPVKLYEYLSLGRPVVATDMADIRPYRDLIYIAHSAEEFAKDLDRSLAETGEELKNRRIEFAKQNTWELRVAAINSAVQTKFALVSVIIVTHNSGLYIEPCIQSILRNASYPNYEIVVVDNASTDRTPEVLRHYAASHPRFRYKCLQENIGFAAGNNVGAKLAGGEYLVLLNADTIVTPGWIGRLLWHLQHDSTLGLLCPVTNFAGNEAKICSDYTDESSMELFAAELSRRARYQTLGVAMVPLFCGVLRRVLYNELQGLDERYGLGMFEDDDLSAAVRARGLRVAVAEDCFVHHFGQAAFSKLAPKDYDGLFETNQRIFEKKWDRAWTPHQLRPGVIPPHMDVRFQPDGFCNI